MGATALKRKEVDKRVVYHWFPNKVKALILYKKFVIHNDAVLLLHISNLCVECSILGERGIAMNPYVKALFSSASLSRHLAKSGSSLILNNMEWDSISKVGIPLHTRCEKCIKINKNKNIMKKAMSMIDCIHYRTVVF